MLLQLLRRIELELRKSNQGFRCAFDPSVSEKLSKAVMGLGALVENESLNDCGPVILLASDSMSF